MTEHQKPERKKRSKPQPPRPTIGFLTRKLTYTWALAQLQGIVEACREREANLICFPGSIIHPDEYEAERNIVYDLASSAKLDGLIVSTSAITGSISDEEGLKDFYRRFHPRPIVGLERPLAGVPTILKTEYESMGELLAHLIEVHGYRRIAYINRVGAGPHQERYRAYMDALAKYDIPYDPTLVFSSRKNLPDFDEHKVRPGVDFEALATSDDFFALPALKALQAQEIRVPEQVAIVGFDDVAESWAITPPLTTVRPPFHEMGYQAVEMLLALLAGEEAPDQVTLPCKLVIRQSCGCMAAGLAQAAQPAGGAKASRETLDAVLAAHRADIVTEMGKAVGVEKPDSEGVGQLVDGFVAEVKGQSPGLFLRRLNEALGQAGTAGNEVRLWQNGLSVLRHWLLPCFDNETFALAEDLWQQARVMIGEAAERAQAYQALQTEQQAQMLREVSQALITTFDVGRLMDVLAESLPRLNFPAGYLSLYETPQPYQYPQPDLGWSRLVLAYDEGRRGELEPGEQRFLSRQLLPESIWPDRQFSFVVEPLYFRDNQLGFALFEMGPREGSPYEALRGQISSALQGALLLQAREEAEASLTMAYTEVEKAYAEVEQQVRERTAELEREQEESARLQQEVIEAQQRVIQELSTPIIPVLEGVIVMPLIGSIDTMRARDVTRRLLAGIREHRAKVVILDITGVPIVDSGVAAYLNKTTQAARLKGARTIVTGVSDAVAETIVDLGIDWSQIETLSDLRVGLRAAMGGLRGRE
jgi:DNA-binding LacI/PurR family transcriptional regulator/anti-anti-sigma regulatory factor